MENPAMRAKRSGQVSSGEENEGSKSARKESSPIGACLLDRKGLIETRKGMASAIRESREHDAEERKWKRTCFGGKTFRPQGARSGAIQKIWGGRKKAGITH